ncbi:hypothetical protein HOK51_10150 [Candidatus Woesearchaeota archaeon]|jgi:hypothetical protein|nr:hypothetical protein [Candidatus Woesearchaeota archaeon]MBT6520186.1 hypothetical protein [Candidatus Woesearchaeota archaeon]MBT7367188.1 hypothetical protein [Candidatus Woesearchaeota archaeon]
MKKIFKSKKAQVRMGETIAILFIFFILLIIGALIYFNIQKTTIRRDIAERFEASAVELSQVVSFLPEIQCTEKNVVEPGCFDLFKIIALSDISKEKQNSAYYSREFGQSLIQIKQIYPFEMSWTLFNNTPDKLVESSLFQIPISIFDASEEASNFGILQIRVFR